MRTRQPSKCSSLALMLGAAFVLATSPLPRAAADQSLGTAALATAAHESHGSRLTVVRTEKLSRVQQRPYAHIPSGADFWVLPARGLTEADLHNLVARCAPAPAVPELAACTAGAEVAVRREGRYYVVRITAGNRAAALQIQRAADRTVGRRVERAADRRDHQ